ncbi:MAG TPA: HAD family phosphatase [Terracidiphilus sp.]|nr:HAD family phosphatase [Terracidiphilus sp.]
MALRAVIFDYGMVLTGQPDLDAHAEMVRISGLPAEHFERLYWADRHAYDEGKLNGITFWNRILKDANLPPSAVAQFNAADTRMWGTTNPGMVTWQAALKQHGLKTAILSNMGDSIHEHITRAHAWITNFDVLVWSYELHVAKPEPEIYLHTLRQLAVQPQEALFLDDKIENIAAARALGIRGIQFSTIDKLRADLLAAGLDAELPLPA